MEKNKQTNKTGEAAKVAGAEREMGFWFGCVSEGAVGCPGGAVQQPVGNKGTELRRKFRSEQRKNLGVIRK